MGLVRGITDEPAILLEAGHTINHRLLGLWRCLLDQSTDVFERRALFIAQLGEIGIDLCDYRLCSFQRSLFSI